MGLYTVICPAQAVCPGKFCGRYRHSPGPSQACVNDYFEGRRQAVTIETVSVAIGRQKVIKTGIFVAATVRLLNNARAVFPTKEPFNMKKTALRAGALALFVAMAAGCATTGLDDVKATADRAAADAAAAISAAEAARAAADRAAQAASAAQSTADQAMSAATQAQSCCEANRESMERMFQKSMSK